MTIESWAPRVPRVPCALVLDTTQAMPRDAMPALTDGLRALRATLYEDPDTRDAVELTVSTCGRRAETVRPFAPPGEWHLPTLHAEGSATLDDALACAMDEIARRTGQYRDTRTPHRRPWLVALTSRAPAGAPAWMGDRLRREARDGCFRFEAVALEAEALDALRALAPEPAHVRLASVADIPAVLAAIGRGLRRAAVA